MYEYRGFRWKIGQDRRPRVQRTLSDSPKGLFCSGILQPSPLKVPNPQHVHRLNRTLVWGMDQEAGVQNQSKDRRSEGP